MTKNIANIKAAAREHLSGNYFQCILTTITFVLTAILVNGALSLLTISFSDNTIITKLVTVFLYPLFLQILQLGLYNYYLKLCCDKNAFTSDIFSGFTINFSRGLRISLFLLAITLICNVPFFLISYCFILTPLQNSLLLLATFILSFFVSTLFIPLIMLVFDFPNKPLISLIKLSVYLMKGNYIKLCLIRLSFIPLYILSILTCGIGILWVAPYSFVSTVVFYLDLVKTKSGEA